MKGREGTLMTAIDGTDVFETFADMLDDTARWRRQKAIEYPDDSRNQWSADLASAIARELRAGVGTSQANQHLNTIKRLWQAGDEFHASETVNEYVARIGFDHAPENAEEFLADVADLLRKTIIVTCEGGTALH